MTRVALSLFVVATFLITGCKTKDSLRRINYYLNASTVEQKSSYMADNYRSFFLTKEGEGKNKKEALASFMDWDGPMHPDIKITSYTIDGNVWTVHFLEQNDFTKLIGFPGWKGTSTFTFNSKRLIEEVLYVPDENNPPYKPYLTPALDWLQKNKPQELNEVYQENKLIQTEVAANKWRELLTLWRRQTNTNE